MRRDKPHPLDLGLHPSLRGKIILLDTNAAMCKEQRGNDRPDIVMEQARKHRDDWLYMVQAKDAIQERLVQLRQGGHQKIIVPNPQELEQTIQAVDGFLGGAMTEEELKLIEVQLDVLKYFRNRTPMEQIFNRVTGKVNVFHLHRRIDELLNEHLAGKGQNDPDHKLYVSPADVHLIAAGYAMSIACPHPEIALVTADEPLRSLAFSAPNILHETLLEETGLGVRYDGRMHVSRDLSSYPDRVPRSRSRKRERHRDRYRHKPRSMRVSRPSYRHFHGRR